jgi:hypothetical protein
LSGSSHLPSPWFNIQVIKSLRISLEKYQGSGNK